MLERGQHLIISKDEMLESEKTACMRDCKIYNVSLGAEMENFSDILKKRLIDKLDSQKRFESAGYQRKLGGERQRLLEEQQREKLYEALSKGASKMGTLRGVEAGSGFQPTMVNPTFEERPQTDKSLLDYLGQTENREFKREEAQADREFKKELQQMPPRPRAQDGGLDQKSQNELRVAMTSYDDALDKMDQIRDIWKEEIGVRPRGTWEKARDFGTEMFGIYGTSGGRYSQRVAALTKQLAKMVEQGKVTDSDYIVFQRSVPKAGDNVKDMQKKVETMKNVINRSKQNYIDGWTRHGGKLPESGSYFEDPEQTKAKLPGPKKHFIRHKKTNEALYITEEQLQKMKRKKDFDDVWIIDNEAE